MMKLAKNAIDLGIVVRNTEACVAFYGDLLGLELEGEVDIPAQGIHMHRFRCGDAVIKLVTLAEPPQAANPPGGFASATGMRYWTIPVENLDEVFAACRQSGHSIPIQLREARPGVRMFIIEDPDGNWVEFVEYA